MPSRRKANIPVHTTDELHPTGLQIHIVDDSNIKDADTVTSAQGIHRDDYYIFLVLKTGAGSMMVDFQYQELTAPGILFVLPGQVHQYISASPGSSSWVIAADSLLISELFQPVFNAESRTGPLSITPQQLEAFNNTCALLNCQLANAPATPYAKPVIHALVTAFAGMVAAVYTEHAGRGKQGQRGAAITSDFRQLLTASYKTMKSPVDYARKMNLSLSYLNEMVKAHTGFPVSYWIQQESMLEARRLLYYTQLSIKEVAYDLGYDDPTYFSRLFKKVVSLSPGDYRKRYRE
ncbi:helix-turn-helix domain-containing protein [Chitinophaga agrisoli]|uniref:Helix-turn-helix domain-containing protein n=1 Tax=Chitinophaga agrisoli TaxID=2607653 RepID=A0A5B2W550_9BACT|nr:helix-turn-helix transcriptional regulator [Chitinophaga agrisoli]KAA2245696.1 helix-turn-helix domain-containing protein [Chitinophaga agrisoli]